MSDAPHRRSAPGWTRAAALLLVLVSVGASGLVMYRDGRFPAAVPAATGEYDERPLMEALQHVDSRGLVDLDGLAQGRAALDAYVAQLAWAAPHTLPSRFATPEARVAFWLNAYDAMVLQALVDARGQLEGAAPAFAPPQWRSWPVGGERLTLAAIERRYLEAAGDPRLFLALFTGQRGHALLDAVPYSGDTLDGQLNDAARRFLRRKENLALEGTTVKLSSVLKAHEADFLGALPPGRGGLLQVVWAFLPDDCEGGRPGCDTRADLDRACGPRLDRCTIEWVEPDTSAPLQGRP